MHQNYGNAGAARSGGIAIEACPADVDEFTAHQKVAGIGRQYGDKQSGGHRVASPRFQSVQR